MTNPAPVFDHCAGVVPLRPRLEAWMLALLNAPQRLHDLVAAHGAPLNIQCDAPFRRNIAALNTCVAEFDLPFLPMFARKANKCLGYVATARDMGIGIDTASHAEVAQCVDHGMPGDRIMCTAAVKDRALMALCATNNVTIILDNLDEVALLEDVAQDVDAPVSVGLRMNGFSRDGELLYSRFGIPLQDIPGVAARLAQSSQVRLDGLHFHLSGYNAADRIAAIAQSLPLIAQVRPSDRRGFFLDIGGGIPMNYLDDPGQWTDWLAALDASLDGEREPITIHNTPLGRRVGQESGGGGVDSYPVAQSLVQSDWMRTVLNAQVDGKALADRLRASEVTLRCEPGRSLLDGCGITVARIAFCKSDSHGSPVIGVQMNRTQSRSGFAEFAIDPLMVPGPASRGDAVEGYIAGTYCTESEWLSHRKMVFAQGARPGDLMIFPNTAGYLMHFLESRSHQFPLAKNVFVTPNPDAPARVDAIDDDAID